MTLACANAGVSPQNITDCILQAHSSWQWDSFAWNPPGYDKPSGDYARALNAAVQQGYAFSLDTLTTIAGSEPDTITFTFTLHNAGVAPIYYETITELSINDNNGIRTVPLVLSIDLLNLLPSNVTTATATNVPVSFRSDGTATVGISLQSSMALKPIFFATNGADSNGIVWTIITKS